MSKLDELIQEYCPDGVEYKEIQEISKILSPRAKVKARDYMKEGKYPIIDQGQKYIGGYTDKEIAFPKGEYIIFGDHTCVVKFIDFQFVQGADGVKVISVEKQILPKFLYYSMSNIKMEVNYKRHWSQIKIVSIPVPPIPVQQEIVRILDNFTMVTERIKKEIHAEYTARKKQYEYYRDKLLAFDMFSEVLNITEKRKIGEVCNVFAGGDVPKEFISNVKTSEYIYPVISNGVGENAVYGYTNIAKVTDNAVTVAARGTIGYAAYRDYPYFPIIRLLTAIPKNNKELDTKYLYYYLQGKKYSVPTSGIPQLTTEMLKKVEISFPTLETQKRIVHVLDNFEKICSDLNIGLPAEIAVRQKQYEYYRDALLTFAAKGDIIVNRTEQNRTEHQYELIKLIQYVFGFVTVQLKDVAFYVKDRIEAQKLNKETYIGVDNLLPNKKGKASSAYVPESGMLTKYLNNDILIGNIRPYLQKIWFASNIGGTNGDVLVIRPYDTDVILPKFLYHVLAADRFFIYDNNNAKGAKMPRGNKKAVMNYEFTIPSMQEQKRIVAILDRFDALCNDLTCGLPAEIAARQKQYEYYRDKLFTFKEAK